MWVQVPLPKYASSYIYYSIKENGKEPMSRITIHRKYYRDIIMSYLQKNEIKYHFHQSKKSDYYFIKGIYAERRGVMKIRVSNHPPHEEHRIPFLQFHSGHKAPFISKRNVHQAIEDYIKTYRV